MDSTARLDIENTMGTIRTLVNQPKNIFLLKNNMYIPPLSLDKSNKYILKKDNNLPYLGIIDEKYYFIIYKININETVLLNNLNPMKRLYEGYPTQSKISTVIKLTIKIYKKINLNHLSWVMIPKYCLPIDCEHILIWHEDGRVSMMRIIKYNNEMSVIESNNIVYNVQRIFYSETAQFSSYCSLPDPDSEIIERSIIEKDEMSKEEEITGEERRRGGGRDRDAGMVS
eukprot:GHVL01007856.1.p1 GENE.GHVL01007856.1~~GHVL01007856.1.p1  ORF type:complete len:238 (-),score=73.52 GHVL01007856.1:529-1212(-)